MRLNVSDIRRSAFNEVIIEHDGEVLVYSVKTAYSRVNASDPNRIFEEINNLIATLPAKAQQDIWEAYVSIHEYLEKIDDTMELTQFIRKKVSAIFKHLSLDMLQHFLLTKAGLFIPSIIPDAPDPKSRYAGSTEQTYYRQHYIELATLALATRLLIPVWGGYIENNTSRDNSGLLKEIDCLAMISDTELVAWPHDAPAFDKLLRYVEIPIEESPMNLATLWKGVSDAEKPMWFLSKVLVRRLTIVPLCDNTVSHSLIANVHRYVRSLLNPSDRGASDRVKDKKSSGAQNRHSDEDKTSMYERYKVKQKTSSGDIKLLEVASEDIATIVKTVDPSIDMGILEQCLEMLEKNPTVHLSEHQRLLAQWVLAKGIPPKAFYHLPHKATSRLVAGAQALIWHWGFLEIAVLMQVAPISISDQDLPYITNNSRPGSRKSSRYDEALDAAYPNLKPVRVRPGKQVKEREYNFATIAINNLTRAIHGGNWKYMGPKALHKLAEQPSGMSLVVIPTTIKNQLAELVLHQVKFNQ